MKLKTIISSLAILTVANVACAHDRLVIHEWGTFTSQEDERGQPIAGINVDDEPVPEFVHRVAPGLIRAEPESAGSGFEIRGKGILGVHPEVTMRLETPVLYVHAPAGFRGQLDVRVAFHGGWLTEFYPNANAVSPGIDPRTFVAGHLSSNTVGELQWMGLTLTGPVEGPATKAGVWLAPRAVAADSIHTRIGETERFLFYRGVGHLDPVLHFFRDPATDLLTVPANNDFEPRQIWLTDIRPDGTAAFRTIALQSVDAPPVVTPGAFHETEYSVTRIADLRASLESALVEQGLYNDEAEALLNTWEVSYFKSPGMRAFFLVPRSWTDRVLPLTVTPAADITRVMVGRIELVTPATRAKLKRMNKSSDPGEIAQAYQDLGRFREALVLADGEPGAGQLAKRLQLAYWKLPEP